MLNLGKAHLLNTGFWWIMRRLIDEKEYVKNHGIFLHLVDIEAKNGDATIDVYFYSHKSTPYVDKKEFYDDFSQITGYGGFVLGHCYDDSAGYDGTCAIYSYTGSPEGTINCELIHEALNFEVYVLKDESAFISDDVLYI